MSTLRAKCRSCCCAVMLLISLSAYTQINIAGRVVDENGNTPLTGASVYFNNTSIATYTNEQGEFYFESISLLNTELVISYPGYELMLYQPTAEQVEKKRIIFKLRLSGQPQKNKIALPEEVRKRWVEFFYTRFLGITKEAKKSTISNANNIYFTMGNNETSFAAYADTPLVVINNELGYKISFNLVEFGYDETSAQSYMLGYTRYDDLGNDKKWLKNRRNCYYGSTLHFYRSLISNQLYEQGFGTFLLQPVTDSSHERLLNIDQANAAASIVMAVPISAQQILFIDSTNNFFMRVKGKLLVQYSSEPSSKRFLKRNIYIAGGLDKGVESDILFKASPIGLNTAGVLSDAASVEYSGYWTYEKAANSLPYNYQPE